MKYSGNIKSVYAPLGASNHSKYSREENDYYATHPSSIDHLFAVEKFSKNIWECACGEGHLSKRMFALGKNVYSTDLIDRNFGHDHFDFLTATKKWRGDIITNPPYKYADKFVYKAMELTNNKVAMFLKLTFLESMGRIALFEKYPPIRILVYSFRQPVARNGSKIMFGKSSAVCFAWFIWELGFHGKPAIDWIKYKK